ncbi:MAG: helix-turn-helix domain-containing protein [Tetragenococcus sp.]|nr:helix-turn-helix domain-containing protein [Tetragenococcus sp.]
MFDTLLEKQDKIIFRLFQYLQRKNPCSLKEASAQLQLSSKSLKRYILLWQQNGSNFSTGISFYIKDQMITAIYSHESAQLFLSVLLSRSYSFQLLVKIIENPFSTFKTLEKEFYLSHATLQRRAQKLQPLLLSYGLRISFISAPTLKGKETQIRYFSLLVSLLDDPPFLWSEQTLYDRYKEIQQYRISQGFVFHQPKQVTGRYYSIPFQINDAGLLFLWKQFSGVETIWLDPLLTDALDFSLYAHTNLKKLTLIPLSQKFHRLHCLCDFYSGSLIEAYDPFFQLKDSQKLVQSFTQLLPNYQHLLTNHPELPILYEKLLQYSFQKEHERWTTAKE